MPSEFNEWLARWIQLVRALRFPVFKDTVIAAGNSALKGTMHLDKFKHKELGMDWYYRFLHGHDYLFGTANQRPIEVSRAKWATSDNIGSWYYMLVEIFVEAEVAVYNQNFRADACPSCDQILEGK